MFVHCTGIPKHVVHPPEHHDIIPDAYYYLLLLYIILHDPDPTLATKPPDVHEFE